MTRRIALDILVVILAFMAPWWVSFSIALLATIVFPRYIEVLFLGLILDSLYNAPVARFHNFQFILTLIAGIFFILMSYMKTIVRVER